MTFDQQVLAAGQPLRREEKVVAKDGAVRTFLSEKIPVRQADGSNILIGFATDITELKASEAVLRNSREELHHTLENLPFSVAVVETAVPGQWTDLGAHCLFFNRHWLDTLGYGTTDVATTEELTHHLYPDPAYRREVWERRTDAVRHAAGNGGTAPAFEVRVTAKDGSVHQMLSGTSVLGNRMIVSMQDITGLRQQQEALRISEERHRFLAENARDVIWTMEPVGRISYLSPSVEAVRGLTPSEAKAQRLEEIHPPESITTRPSAWKVSTLVLWCRYA
jgi:PAS domain-containing protein